MKKDLKNEKLLDEQLGRVQGGASKNIVTVHCQQCPWTYEGPADVALTAQKIHTRDTGHRWYDSRETRTFE
ncbi:MAG: hypothetical protein BWY65_01528 [Firmicutes bacterium ADurb.Bin373]|nr:hypothetical protein [Bacillota bacterium]OQA08310.1 MAG: hypothetical protein BWY65_01528 [Firmicutes bacterium ADurb.Bin373]